MISRVSRWLAAAVLSITASFASTAVNLNASGIGEALIFPYYTARGGQVTLISVFNQTSQAKAIKVHLREAKNGASVYSFNLFLAAEDVWTAAISSSADGAQIVTNDESCTWPRIKGTPRVFYNRNFANDAPSLRTLDRTREGYIEMIEMARILPNSAIGRDIALRAGPEPTAAKTASCQLVSDSGVAQYASDFYAPNGGLSGTAMIVGDSMSTGYDATALEALEVRIGVTASDSASPDWSDVSSKTATLTYTTSLNDYEGLIDTRMVVARFDRGLDAVSAVLMASSLTGEYNYNDAFGSDWVVTMPTKRLYVNGTAPLAPFQRRWNGESGNGTAKSDIEAFSASREGDRRTSRDCFTQKPEDLPGANWSASVFRFSNGKLDTRTPFALFSNTSQLWTQVESGCGLRQYAAQEPTGEGGWGAMSLGRFEPFDSFSGLQARSDSFIISVKSGAVITTPLLLLGLPAVGFSIVAARFPGATQNNFNSSFSLKATRSILW